MTDDTELGTKRPVSYHEKIVRTMAWSSGYGMGSNLSNMIYCGGFSLFSFLTGWWVLGGFLVLLTGYHHYQFKKNRLLWACVNEGTVDREECHQMVEQKLKDKGNK